jgi:uncharacterized protein (DUF433 family)
MVNSELSGMGIYTVSQAARILGTTPTRVRGWAFGYPNTKSDPIIKNELSNLDGQLAISFASLIEARFINEFAKQGVAVRSIRIMAEEARRAFETPHPFANVRFRTDGKVIFADVAELTGDKKLYDLKAKNWVFYDIITGSLNKGVHFDELSGNAKYWEPANTKNIILHPKIAFGEPVLRDSKIPTRTLFDAFNVEGETYKSVAKWYGIQEQDVTNAVKYELSLNKAA